MNAKLHISNRLAAAILLAIISSPALSDEVDVSPGEGCHGQGVNDSGAIVFTCQSEEFLYRRRSDEDMVEIRLTPGMSCDVSAIANNGTAFANCISDQKGAYVWLPQQSHLTAVLPALGHITAAISSVTPSGVAIGTTTGRLGLEHPALWRSPTVPATELKVGLLGIGGEDCVANSAEDEDTSAPDVVGSCPNSERTRQVAVVWRRDGLLVNYVAHKLPFPAQSNNCVANLVVGNKVVGVCTFIEGSPREDGVYTVAWYGTDAPKVLTPDGGPSTSQPIGVLKDGSVAGYVRRHTGQIGDRAFIWRPVNNDLTIFSATLDPAHPQSNVRPKHYSESGFLVGIAERVLPGEPPS